MTQPPQFFRRAIVVFVSAAIVAVKIKSEAG